MQQNDMTKTYKKQQIESASPAQLVVLLYAGAIDFLNKAELAHSKQGVKWIEDFHKNLISCQNIITELMCALDMEKGGEIASNLFRLYDFMHYRLVDANMKKELKAISEVRDILQTLKRAWDKVAAQEPQLNVPKTPRPSLNLQG